MIKRSIIAVTAALLLAGGLVGCSGQDIPPKYDWVCGSPSTKSDCSDTKQGKALIAAEKAAKEAKTNPKKGWVDVFKNLDAGSTGNDLSNLMKRCDGTTLIYNGSGMHNNPTIAVVPNSPECVTKDK